MSAFEIFNQKIYNLVKSYIIKSVILFKLHNKLIEIFEMVGVRLSHSWDDSFWSSQLSTLLSGNNIDKKCDAVDDENSEPNRKKIAFS